MFGALFFILSCESSEWESKGLPLSASDCRWFRGGQLILGEEVGLIFTS